MSFVQGGNVFGDRTQGYTFAPPYLYRHRGVGDAATQVGSSVAGATASILALSPATGPAAPFVAAAAVLVGLIGNLFHGCGNTCVQATQYANQAGSQLQTLMAQYFALPTPRPYAAQQAYLQSFTQVVAWLQQMCGNSALGNAGQRCISERLTRRACPSTLNDSNMGGGQISFCDYWSTFYDPVADDPNVAPQSSAVASSPAASSDIGSTLSGILSSPWLIPGALVLVGGMALLSD